MVDGYKLSGFLYSIMASIDQGRIQGEKEGEGLGVNPPFLRNFFNLLGFLRKKSRL